jgi:hypothetical protein
MLVRLHIKVRVIDEGPSTVVQVHVMTLTGKRFPVACTPDETVEDLKHHILGIEGIPLDQQRLIFAGRQLEDDAELSRCGLSNGCTLHLVLKLGGC